MKSLILSFIIISLFSNVMFGQKTYYHPVVIYSLTENTIVKKNGKELILDSLIICHYNERIDVIS